ncbi:MAG TPA: hypothetical protein VF166_10330 [Gemmatimonadaceae bacterium]
MTVTMSPVILGMLQAPADPTWPAAMAGISTLIIAILLLVVVLFLVVAGLKLRATVAQLDDLLRRFSGDIGPVTHRLRSIADSADEITTSVRTDVHRLSDTIMAANDGLRDALAIAERRLKEFDALVRVVRHEAEDAIVSAAATVRGVRALAASIGDETAAALAFGDDEDIEEEIDDGDDIEDTPAARRPEPRVRPGRGGRGRAGRV